MRPRALALTSTILCTVSEAQAQISLCPTDPEKALYSIESARGQSFVTANVSAGIAVFLERAPWFGEPEFNLGGDPDDWAEGFIEPQLRGQYALPGRSRLCGGLSAVGSATRGGLDAAGSNLEERAPEDTTLEEAYLAVLGEEILPISRDHSVELSIGRHDYKVGTGFLFYDGASDGGRRGAYWIDRRQAFGLVGRAAATVGDALGEAVYLEGDERDPDTNTRVAGVNLELPIDALDLGASFYQLLDSDLDTRDGMSVYDLRIGGKAWGFSAAGELAYETNGDDLEAFGGYAQIGYDFDMLGTDLRLSYRYAFLSGDDPDSSKSEAFDPLYYGLYESGEPGSAYQEVEWGSWFQGEIIGEFVLPNSNLKTHMVRLTAYPSEQLWLNLIYYNFALDEPAGLDPSVTSSDFANEVDFIVEVAPTRWLYLNGVIGVAFPGDAAEEFTLGDDPWVHFMLYTQIDF